MTGNSKKERITLMPREVELTFQLGFDTVAKEVSHRETIPVEDNNRYKNIKWEYSQIVKRRLMRVYFGWKMKIFPCLAKKFEPYLNSPRYSLCVDTGHLSSRTGFTVNYINSELSLNSPHPLSSGISRRWHAINISWK